MATALSLSFAGPVRAAEVATEPFISEIHYDNSGADSGEAIEIEAPVGFDLTGWQIVLYNGTGGAAYGTTTLSGVVPAAGVVVQNYPANGIQNGAPDGVALVNAAGAVTEFLTLRGHLRRHRRPRDGHLRRGHRRRRGRRHRGHRVAAEDRRHLAGPGREQLRHAATPLPRTPIPTRNPSSAAPSRSTTRSPRCRAPARPPALAGTRVTVEGVVTADHRTGGYNGIYVQTAGSGGDRPVAAGTASDAIFVFLPTGTAPAVAIGDRVRVSGTANEFNGFTQLSIAAKSDVQICAHGAPLPAPVPLSLPLGDEARESAEGMLVAPVGAYTVSDVYNTNRFGEIILAAGNAPARVPTDVARPGTPEAAQVKAANKLGRILLDDGKTTNLSAAGLAPPYLSKDDPVRVGDTVESFGPAVLGFSFNEWRLQPTTPVDAATPAVVAHRRSRTPTRAPPRRSTSAATSRLASFNVLNYFVHFGGEARGADDAAALAKQQAKIVSAITALDADVIALMEIENSVRFNAEDPQQALKTLVGALNAVDGAGTWDYVRSPAELPAAAQQDFITTAIIFKPAKVTPEGRGAVDQRRDGVVQRPRADRADVHLGHHHLHRGGEPLQVQERLDPAERRQRRQRRRPGPVQR